MAIKDWPKLERPREKLLARGAHALSDSELLAIFLRTGLPGRSAVDLARELLAEYGGLRALLAADERTFCRGPGLGAAKYAQLQACLEMARRHLGEQLQRGDVLENPDATCAYLSAHLRHRKQEVFAVLFLNNRHQVLAFEELFFGTIDGAAVHPRELVRRSLHHNAAAVIAAHNHPSGVAEPSRADRDITARLKAALALVDVRLLDHLVIGEGAPYSFASHGLL